MGGSDAAGRPGCDIVIFGAASRTAVRSLLPALYHLELRNGLPRGTRICAVSRRRLGAADYRATVRTALVEALAADWDDGVGRRLLGRIDHVALERSYEHQSPLLAQALGAREAPPDRLRLFLLAVPAAEVPAICAGLRVAGLDGPGARVVHELPVGDLPATRAVDRAVAGVVDEERTYRVDHFLGRSSVRRLLRARRPGGPLEAVWDRRWVDHVQLTVAETSGAARRPAGLERVGALHHMVQAHLLQLLSVVAMEPPAAAGAEALHARRAEVLRALRPMRPTDVDRCAVRGQYVTGWLGGRLTPGYGDERGDPTTATETFVALRAEVATPRWAGVPFYLRAGQRMGASTSDIVVVFKDAPADALPLGAGSSAPRDLHVQVEPDGRVRLRLVARRPGSGGPQPMDLDLGGGPGAGDGAVASYRRLLADALRGDRTHFLGRDEVEAGRRWVDPVAQRWRSGPSRPAPYAAGSPGPLDASALLERDHRQWQEIA